MKGTESGDNSVASALAFVGSAVVNMFTAGLVAKLAPIDSCGQGYFLTTIFFSVRCRVKEKNHFQSSLTDISADILRVERLLLLCR